MLSRLLKRGQPAASAPAAAPVEAAFDEEAYLRAHPDVRAAVAAGTFDSGAAHYAAFGRAEGRALALRIARSAAELDAEIARLREIERRSFSDWLRARASFTFEEDVSTLPADPFSPDYRDRQLALYCTLSGRSGYEPWSAEAYAMPIDTYVDPRPYPYCSGDGDLIGGHLIAVGRIMQAMWRHAPRAGLRVLEYGCGTGVTTTVLAASGHQVTAVDISKDMLAIVGRIAAGRGLELRTHVGEFGTVPVEGERFDAILFYEAFHHCLEFETLLHTLQRRLAPGGALFLAGEPVIPDFPKPWGLRLDGASIFDIRANGWLELGFREDFFHLLLERTGWTAETWSMAGLPNLYVLRPRKG